MIGTADNVKLPRSLNVALVHDWITECGGPESVLQSLTRVFPGAPLYLGIWSPNADAARTFGPLEPRTTWLQRVPGARANHRYLLPLMARAFEDLDLQGADLVFSSSHALAKSARARPDAVHICYCHTPPRYLWSQFNLYNAGVRGALRTPLMRYIRRRDRKVAQRVDHFLANSRHVAGRIRRNYGRESRVIYPPVDVGRFREADADRHEYFLTGGRLAPYKRIEVAIEAANLGYFPLKVFGDGPNRGRLEALAGPTVEFLGHVPDVELPQLFAGARALLFPGEEDFGIVSVEVQAAGRPVVAWDRGGARETVLDGRTGVLYEDGSARGLLEGIERLEEAHWRPEVARRNAERFDRERFEEEIVEEVYRVLKGRRLDRWQPRLVQQELMQHGFVQQHATNGNGASPAAGHVGCGIALKPGANRNLITGGAGFIGSHLAEALLAGGEEVTVVDDLSTGDRANIAHLLPHPRFHFHRGSVMDHGLMEALVRGADRIFHLAAAVGVKLIMERPVDTVVTNVRGTEIVLELASHYRRKILVASTSEVYGKAMEMRDGDGGNLAETDNWTLGPTHRRRWAYACSKAMDEFLALAYHDETELPVVVIRFFNTVGPRQKGRYGMVIPNFVKSALLGRPITVHGDGEQTRSFTHVDDGVRAMLGLMKCPGAMGQVVNIGNGAEITMNALAQRVKALTGSDSPILHVPYEEVYGPGFEDMRARTPDISKIRSLIGFDPEHDLERILGDVIRFYRGQLGLPASQISDAVVGVRT